MSLALVDPQADDTGHVIRRLPHRYVVSPRGSYVHLPRSARHYSRGQRTWFYVDTLCGQHLRNPTFTDDPASSTCGTCLGRDLGLSEPDVLWRPRTIHTLPKWCRGSGVNGQRLWVDIPGSRHVRCLMCDQEVRWWGDGPVRHDHHGTGLACPAHGASRLLHSAGRVVCLHHACTLTPYRFWVITPHGRPTETPDG